MVVAVCQFICGQLICHVRLMIILQVKIMAADRMSPRDLNVEMMVLSVFC